MPGQKDELDDGGRGQGAIADANLIVSALQRLTPDTKIISYRLTSQSAEVWNIRAKVQGAKWTLRLEADQVLNPSWTMMHCVDACRRQALVCRGLHFRSRLKPVRLSRDLLPVCCRPIIGRVCKYLSHLRLSSPASSSTTMNTPFFSLCFSTVTKPRFLPSPPPGQEEIGDRGSEPIARPPRKTCHVHSKCDAERS